MEETCTTEKYSWIHNKKNPNFTYYSTNHENQNDTPQHRSATYSNDTYTTRYALQIDEENVTKEFILDPSYF